MSHFSCLVIGPDVDAQLQPFHEFECTGTDDQYVKDVDITDEARDKYAKATSTRPKAPDGSLHDFFDADGNWRTEYSQPDPVAPLWDRNRRTYFVPAGWAKVDVPTPEIKTFSDWVYGWYGITVRKVSGVERVIKRTNPNGHWDWWVIGGRWSGFLKLKVGQVGALGEPGVMGSYFASGPDRADQALKGAIDLDGMRDQAGEKAGIEWDKCHAIIGTLTWQTWDHVRETVKPIDAARDFYGQQEAVAALRKADREAYGWEIDDTLSGPRDSFVQAARDRACVPFAIVYKGEWCQKGRMGWFGCSSNEMPQSNWNRLVSDLVDGLPDDTMLTAVDCHT